MISWVEELRGSIQLAKQLIDQARDQADPKRIRLVKQALMASEHLGKCLERAAKLSEIARDLASFERFNQSIIDAIQKEGPEVARRVLRRLGDWLNTNYPVEERCRRVV
ncbi:MAG TPA: hypothetical protein VKI44_03590 [Acetobacteraceae bacterium]|nr:hypothetical protein [Acetobacteraceae bacterium]